MRLLKKIVGIGLICGLVGGSAALWTTKSYAAKETELRGRAAEGEREAQRARQEATQQRSQDLKQRQIERGEMEKPKFQQGTGEGEKKVEPQPLEKKQ